MGWAGWIQKSYNSKIVRYYSHLLFHELHATSVIQYSRFGIWWSLHKNSLMDTLIFKQHCIKETYAHISETQSAISFSNVTLSNFDLDILRMHIHVHIFALLALHILLVRGADLQCNLTTVAIPNW